MHKEIRKITFEGRSIRVNSVCVEGKLIISTGKFVKIAKLEKEFIEEVEDPNTFINEIRNDGLEADIFTFLQPFPDNVPKYEYYMEWDNVAAIPISGYENWWQNQIPKQTRRAIRKAGERGVKVKLAELNNDLIKGIMEIFNETPVRQGKRFWHYGKNFEQIEREMLKDIDRSEFIGAYYREELIGFIKLLYGKNYARTVQNISKIKHREKYPVNALIAKSVEICCDRNIPYLVYGQYEYSKAGSGNLTEFKRHNGFVKMELPRYYLPLSTKGRIFLKLGVHHGIIGIIPKKIIIFLIGLRKKWYTLKYGKG